MKNYNEIADSVLSRRDRYDETQRIKRKNMVHISTFIGCFIAIVAFGLGIWQGGLFDHSPKEDNYVENTSNNTTDKNDIASHGGNGESQIEIDVNNPEQVPKELLIDSNLTGKVKYLSGIYTKDQYSEENRTPERAEMRLLALKELLSYAKASDYSVEYLPDEIFPRVELPDAKIISFTSYLGIESNNLMEIGMTDDLTDKEIIKTISEDRYTNALMQYIGLDLDNLYVYRETIYRYGDSNDISHPESKQTIFRIANYSDVPQQLALNIQSNYIKFWIIENYTEHSLTTSSVYGYYVPENCEYELTDYVSYDEAIELAKQKEKHFAVDKISACTVVYNPDIESGRLMPYYQFYYRVEEKNYSVLIPLAR